MNRRHRFLKIITIWKASNSITTRFKTNIMTILTHPDKLCLLVNRRLKVHIGPIRLRAMNNQQDLPYLIRDKFTMTEKCMEARHKNHR